MGLNDDETGKFYPTDVTIVVPTEFLRSTT